MGAKWVQEMDPLKMGWRSFLESKRFEICWVSAIGGQCIGIYGFRGFGLVGRWVFKGTEVGIFNSSIAIVRDSIRCLSMGCCGQEIGKFGCCVWLTYAPCAYMTEILDPLSPAIVVGAVWVLWALDWEGGWFAMFPPWEKLTDRYLCVLSSGDWEIWVLSYRNSGSGLRFATRGLLRL